jgi:hypothetical protein
MIPFLLCVPFHYLYVYALQQRAVFYFCRGDDFLVFINTFRISGADAIGTRDSFITGAENLTVVQR